VGDKTALNPLFKTYDSDRYVRDRAKSAIKAINSRYPDGIPIKSSNTKK
jgi:hypothetical protein